MASFAREFLTSPVRPDPKLLLLGQSPRPYSGRPALLTTQPPSHQHRQPDSQPASQSGALAAARGPFDNLFGTMLNYRPGALRNHATGGTMGRQKHCQPVAKCPGALRNHATGGTMGRQKHCQPVAK
jgi:hypothetical protein